MRRRSRRPRLSEEFSWPEGKRGPRAGQNIEGWGDRSPANGCRRGWRGEAHFVYRAVIRLRPPFPAGLLGCAALAAATLAPAVARAADAPDTAAGGDASQTITLEQAQSAITPTKKDESTLPAPPPEAPPPPPRHKGVVLQQDLGVLGFAGKFGGLTGHPAFWMHTQLGYELFKWLMLYGEGELAYTDTVESVGPSQNRGIPILGFGGGARFTVHFTDRVAMYLQGGAGGATAYVKSNVLTNYGYHNAESVGFWAGGRLGLEWYQIDRHMALALSGGARYLTNFARVVGSDLPLAWDATLGLRYTF